MGGAWEGVHENVSSPMSGTNSFSHNLPHQMTVDSNIYDGYDKSQEQFTNHSTAVQAPEVNLQNVLTGMVTILTGRNQLPVDGNYEDQQGSSTDISFLASEKNGDCSQLHSSVYLPSLPQQVVMETLKYNDCKEVLETDPPEWLPDSYTTACMQCASAFTAFTRGRHHCRFCGGVFCRACTKGRCIMPVKFRLRDPQRVCDKCYDRLDPLQGLLINSLSNSAQTAKHDVLDWTSMRGWINLPVSLSMEHEIYKASNSLKIYYQAARLKPEICIPQVVLNGASGLAILTVAKVGALLTYKFGTGLVIARRFDGSWSAPSAIVSFGLGWGAQIGGELTDYIIVLHGFKAVKAFTSQMHISLGAGLSAAAGPVGRVVEADFRAGDRGSGMCYTYSFSKGAFVGVSLEGNIVLTRMDTNLSFYGDPYLTARDILLGNVERPRAAQMLYSTLHNIFSSQ